MEARYDEVLSESTKLAALGKEMTSDFSSDGLPTIAPFRAALGGVSGTPVIVAGGYDTENIWDVVDSRVSLFVPLEIPSYVRLTKLESRPGRSGSILHLQPRLGVPHQARKAARQVCPTPILRLPRERVSRGVYRLFEA